MLKSLSILKIVQLHLYLLIWFEAAETLTDQLTDLGQNVTINCSFDDQEVNWLLLKLPDPPVVILRTFSSGDPVYYNNRFRHKYPVQSKNHLFINNVTVDDLGLYYCVTKATHPKYNNGTRLHIIEPTAEIQIKNHTMVCTEQNQKHWQIIICVLLNIVLIVVIIGLLTVFVLGSRRTGDKHFQNTNRQQPQVMNLEPPQDPCSQVQYAAADFSTPCQRFQSRQINSTYALLEMPKARTPNH